VPQPAVSELVVPESVVRDPAVRDPAVRDPAVREPAVRAPVELESAVPEQAAPGAQAQPTDLIAAGIVPDRDAEIGPDDDTVPIPVILPDQPLAASAQPQDVAEADDRVRGPFEPAERPQRQAVAAPRAAAVQPRSSAPTKMDQIKDLYLTAEAIGDDALAKYFEQVSERQRQLIKEYFDQAVARRTDGQTTA
jgi:hypothetical protein